MNRRNLTYKLAVNHFADRREDEVAHLSGLQFTPRDKRGDLGQDADDNVDDAIIPEEKNWRHYGMRYYKAVFHASLSSQTSLIKQCVFILHLITGSFS